MKPRVWAEVDLSAIRQNVDAIRSFVGLRVDVMPVVKADAYGHGAVEVARAALSAGADWLGVASVAEGAALRKVLPNGTVCLLSPFEAADADEIVAQRLTPAISDLDGARALSVAAQKQRTGVRVHMKVDTGMGRQGVMPELAERLASVVARMPSIVIEGLFTHFACADDDPEFTARQLAVFEDARQRVLATDTRLKPVHCAASAALLRYPEARLDLVRPGLLVYGIMPPIPAEVSVPPLRPAMTLRTRIVQVRNLPAGHGVSYARTRILTRPSRIAVLPVGYGDGYPRALSNIGRVLVNEAPAPIVGRVCMDMTLVDVTDIPGANVGSEVVLIGRQGAECIRVEEIAKLIDTTEHDVTTRLTPRVPRVYVASGSAVAATRLGNGTPAYQR